MWLLADWVFSADWHSRDARRCRAGGSGRQVRDFGAGLAERFGDDVGERPVAAFGEGGVAFGRAEAGQQGVEQAGEDGSFLGELRPAGGFAQRLGGAEVDQGGAGLLVQGGDACEAFEVVGDVAFVAGLLVPAQGLLV